MDKQAYKEVLESTLKIMQVRLEECGPELAPKYAETIVDLADRIYALDRGLNY